MPTPSREQLAKLRKLGALLEHMRRRRVEAPLSMSRLWTHPNAPTDQRRLAIESLTHPLTVQLGGNRSGKSYAGWDCDVAVACGRDHPHTQAWCRLNGIDPMLIPEGPGDVYVLSQTAGASRKTARPAIDARLPPGAQWVGRNALQEAYVRIPVPGHARDAIIWFGSVDQGPKAVKGTEARRYHIDEEPEGPEGKLVVEECLRGASSLGGKVSITATPQAGLTWMIEELVQQGKYGAVSSRLNSLHNRFARNYAALVAWLDGLEPEERRMREEGIWVDRRGLIYTGWMRYLHHRGSIEVDGQVVTAGSIPATWRRYRALDFGQTNPTAVVWGAVHPATGLIVVYRAAKESHVPYPEWAERIHRAEGGVRDDKGRWRQHTEHIQLCWGDPSDPGAIRDLCMADVPTHGAHREVDAGISDVRDAMRVDAAGMPGLVILHGDGTGELVRDLEGYRYDPAYKAPTPLKTNDHLPDALRDLVRGIREVEGRRRGELAASDADAG